MSPFTSEDDNSADSELSFYAYALNLPGTQRPGVVDVLVDSHSWLDAVVACQEFCSFVYNAEVDRGYGDPFGRGAIHLFYQLQRTVPCAVSVRCYGYVVGITTDPKHLEWLSLATTS